MSVLHKLSTSLNRRDEVPNQELAKKIADSNDKKSVGELFVHLNNKNKGIQNDCIKVIYEIGTLKSKLITGFADNLIALLENKNNRLQWGAMIALDIVCHEIPATIYAALPKIIDAANKGSVITNDHCVGILIKLCKIRDYAANTFPLLNERLLICPTNQLPMYAENALPIINANNKTAFLHTLTARLGEIEKESKRLRIQKVIKRATNL